MVSALADELRDRFGALPGAVEGLLYQIRVKLLAQAAGATAVQFKDRTIAIRLPYLHELKREALGVWLTRAAGGMRDVTVTRVAVELKVTPTTWRDRLLTVLTRLGEVHALSVSV